MNLFLQKLELRNNSDVEFIEKLYIENFPPNERRPLTALFKLIQENEKFDLYIILNNENQRIGFVSVWHLTNFVFLEHFAISQDFRNGGYGKLVLKYLTQNITSPIIGEIELPELSEIAQRRKLFYERCGFKVWNIVYQQPPYEAEFEPIPMKLISYGNIDLDTEFEQVKRELYTNVYITNY